MYVLLKILFYQRCRNNYTTNIKRMPPISYIPLVFILSLFFPILSFLSTILFLSYITKEELFLAYLSLSTCHSIPNLIKSVIYDCDDMKTNTKTHHRYKHTNDDS